ncbi:hypothetical protein Fcan01_25723 [Folsomia candida]|uniref:ER-bound oxygenase mpaB/mpaB'/Rubber oxygenase catalytic domain-containing protein n=1 Tax=Folsomia candida TaxID=158441 RepID=A0A226D384_FOLCA|nr:hypothetical protein Fcan01_25723 [Folsomia candida]
MKSTTAFACLSWTTFIFRTGAYLTPPCSKIPFQPGCTNNLSLVTPTLPACPFPFEEWVIAARAAPGNSTRPDGVIPPWFNRPLALRGQQVASEYRFPWYVATIFGALTELNMPDIRDPIMFNKKHTNGPDNAKRDMATLMQGLVWAKDYFYDMPIEGNSSYIDSIRNVAAIHANVEMRARARQASDGCIVSRNEYAYPILFPKEMAINACDADFWAINHFFAAIGYGLGIDEKYNIFLQPDLKSARIYYRKIHEQVIIPSLFNFDKQTKLMMDNILKGLSTLTSGILSPPFMMHRFLHNFLNQPAPRLQALMSPRELAFDRALDFAYKP